MKIKIVKRSFADLTNRNLKWPVSTVKICLTFRDTESILHKGLYNKQM